ncbi:unnamed protein product [Fusarium graminearum]|nr:unnamed protein product [Fusarium graminearum]
MTGDSDGHQRPDFTEVSQTTDDTWREFDGGDHLRAVNRSEVENYVQISCSGILIKGRWRFSCLCCQDLLSVSEAERVGSNYGLDGGKGIT